jgi:hypothetical protein
VIVFDCGGIVCQEFVPSGQMVNQHYNWEVLQHLREQVCWEHLEWWHNQNWFIHHGCGPPTPLLAWFGPLWFLLVSENEIPAKRVSFPGCLWNSGTITDHPTSDSKMSVPAVLPAVAEMLDLVHKLGRGLLWKWYWPVTKVSIYFIMNSIWELFDTPLCFLLECTFPF